MPTGVLLLIVILTGVFIIIYKRQMLIKMFSINIASMADEFRMEMETTADRAVKKLEHQMAQLEYLLDEADAKILALEDRLRLTEEKCSCAPGESSQNTMQCSSNTLTEGALSPVLQQPIPEREQTNDGCIQPQTLTQHISRLQDVNQDKRQQVIAMHRQGYNVIEIAKAISMGKGEVMLLLELNKN